MFRPVNRLAQSAFMAIAVALAGTGAHANPPTSPKLNCAAFDIEVDENPLFGRPRFRFACQNDVFYTTNYVTQNQLNTGDPCLAWNQATDDQVKLWASTVMSALASGKLLTVYWGPSCKDDPDSHPITGVHITSVTAP